MCAVPADADSAAAVDWADLDTRLLCDHREKGDGKPVLSCASAADADGATVTPDGFVHFPARAVAAAEVPIPATAFRVSGQALLGGKAPLLRLAVRAVQASTAHRGAAPRPLLAVRGAESTTFHVTTTRTRHNKKPPVPRTIDAVKHIVHMGDKCVEKLFEFDRTAAHHGLEVPAGCGSVTTVGQLREVIRTNAGTAGERRLCAEVLKVNEVCRAARQHAGQMG